MASSIVKSNRMKTEFKKSHSSWWDSHISSKNSKWLQENLEEMDQNVKKMVKLIEEDADSFAKKAELYFKKRPELLSLVEEFQRMYRSLAERYGHVTGELRKNIPSDLQSQGSGISDAGSEPPWTLLSPDRRPGRTKSGPRAAGFDFFLGSGGSCSDLNSKEGDDTSTTLDSDSESDDSSVNNYSSTRSNGGGDEQPLRGRVVELEGELREVKEKLRRQQHEMSEGLKKENFEVHSKIATYDEELRVAREKIQLSEEEIARLMAELQKCKSLGDHEDIPSESVIFGSSTTHESDLRKEVANLQQELTSKGESVQNLQDQLKLAQKEVIVWKNKLEREKRDMSKLHDRIARYKANLADRDQEIRGLREAMSNANKSLSEENERLQSEMKRMTKEKAYLEHHIKELDLRCQSLEEEARRARAAKDEIKATLGAQLEQLMADITERDKTIDGLNHVLDELKLKHEMLTAVKHGLDVEISALGNEMSIKNDQITQMRNDLDDLRTQHDELAVEAKGLGSRVKELETELEMKQETIVEAAERKREAIRQLSYSVEYYRGEYHELRLALIAHKRPAAMAR